VELDIAAAAVEGDPDLVHRSAFNLVLNAVQHSPEGAPVSVRVEPVSGSAIPPGAGFSAGARLDVSDRGAGIDPATAARMFDPFFTTRTGGSGLGLALVHRAVEAHEGRMFIDSEPGRGTSVTVYLPAELAEVAP
jgi:signal transduction histidine kinase